MFIKSFISLMFLVLGVNVFAQSYDKNLRCEVYANRQYIKNIEICLRSDTMASMHRCKVDMWEAFGKATCSNFGRSSAAAQIFLEKRKYALFEDVKNGKISAETWRKQTRELREMSSEEYERMNEFIDGELDDMEATLAVRRNYNFYAQVIGILGGISNNASRANQNNGMTTYIVNGRAITCTTMGSFVTCN